MNIAAKALIENGISERGQTAAAPAIKREYFTDMHKIIYKLRLCIRIVVSV